MKSLSNPVLMAEFENTMVRQKDHLLRDVNRAEDGMELRAVLTTLRFVTPMWEAVGYGYKVREITARIADAAKGMLEGKEGYLPSYRKGSKDRAVIELDIERLNGIVEACR